MFVEYDEEQSSLIKSFVKDTSNRKINLTGGEFIPAFDVVKEAAKDVVNNPRFNNGYLRIGGLDGFKDLACELLLGKDSTAIKEKRVIGFQAVGGSGALTLAGKMLSKVFGMETILIPKSTWEPHLELFQSLMMDIKRYIYYDLRFQRIDFEGLIGDIKKAREKTIILFQVCCHNPTGGDLTQNQWETVMKVVKDRKLFPLFDAAYLGLGSDLETDAFPVRLFERNGVDFVACQTFSKIFAFCNERTANITAVFTDPVVRDRVLTELESIVKNSYGMPPAFGAKIVYHVLSNPSYFSKWKTELANTVQKFRHLRIALRESFSRKLPGFNFDFITNNYGYYVQLNFTGDEQTILRYRYHIYVRKNGRIDLRGLTHENIEYFTDSIISVLFPD